MRPLSANSNSRISTFDGEYALDRGGRIWDASLQHLIRSPPFDVWDGKILDLGHIFGRKGRRCENFIEFLSLVMDFFVFLPLDS